MMCASSFLPQILLLLSSLVGSTFAFQTLHGAALVTKATPWLPQYTTTVLHASEASAEDVDIEAFLEERYPAFMMILRRNEKACKILRESTSVGFTVFAPTDASFQELGETKCAQLTDPRNTETAEKIGAYHVIAEPVSATALFNAGGIITMGGEVPIDRSTSGGFFGAFGGKEDGGVTVNGAKVLQTIELGNNGIVHETDGLISPNLLWRYMDQLRIPGSK
ncbi:Beta-Ig-H3 fasciclin [Seminavis robusta]|uniref:Beta-Ig-H3 fasciclin n=1 Tax=Seminavis robusta TaxID=568900 RepID=A0A9N8HM16_9STRA|nr:Beta-Ig-H3 fasciclin [Seminavis robusta]|eukprot:Sro962_g225160.1 Beta-Ig-H3 fasciclin (222) ;mRNA; r:27962-28627